MFKVCNFSFSWYLLVCIKPYCMMYAHEKIQQQIPTIIILENFPQKNVTKKISQEKIQEKNCPKRKFSKENVFLKKI